MDIQSLRLIRNMNQVQKPKFLLVQNDVLAVANRPTKLPFSDLDLTQPWKVLVGTINEFGHEEIVGVAAEAYPDDDPHKTCWRVTSPIDTPGRLIGAVGTMAGIIHNRVGVLFYNGLYHDLVNLPPTIIVQACNARGK